MLHRSCSRRRKFLLLYMIRKSPRFLHRTYANCARPDVMAQPDLHDNKVYPHNTYVVSSPSSSTSATTNKKQSDELKSYIDWAIKNDFAVMDVTLPSSSPRFDELGNPYDSFTAKSNEQDISIQCKELLVYLWENWLELIGNTSITLMGVGDANLGIKQLLQAKGTFLASPPSLPFLSPTLSLPPCIPKMSIANVECLQTAHLKKSPP